MKLLVVAATEMEMGPVRQRLAGNSRVAFLVCGVGPVAAAVNLTNFLARQQRRFDLVIHCGVAGAYLDAGAQVLDICLAVKEILGDLGICLEDRILELDGGQATVEREFDLDDSLVNKAAAVLRRNDMSHRTGRFVTVSCASGSARRGVLLRDKHQALCENMEGAAVVLASKACSVPCLEIRCVSNLVEDRNPAAWRLDEACQKGAAAVALLVAANIFDHM